MCIQEELEGGDAVEAGGGWNWNVFGGSGRKVCRGGGMSRMMMDIDSYFECRRNGS